MKLTESQCDVEKSQLILKSLSEEEIRGLRRSAKQVRDETKGLTPHNCKRSKASRKRMRRFQSSILRRSESILASPWSVDSLRNVARENLKISDQCRYGTSDSREASQSSATRHRGNGKKQRSKRNRTRKVSAIKRKNPESSADEIYEELETEEIKSCKNFSLVDESMEESGDCEDSDLRSVESEEIPKANAMHVVFADKDDGWTIFMIREKGTKVWKFPRMRVEQELVWTDPEWDKVRTQAIRHYLGIGRQDQCSLETFNSWFNGGS